MARPRAKSAVGPVDICQISEHPASFYGREIEIRSQFVDASPHGWFGHDDACPSTTVILVPRPVKLEEFLHAVASEETGLHVLFIAKVAKIDFEDIAMGRQQHLALLVSRIIRIEKNK